MNNRILTAIVSAELAAGLYLRWTLPGLWGPWALVSALFLVAGTFSAWGRLEHYLGRRQSLAQMEFMRTARDPWRAYPSEVEMTEHRAAAARGSR